MLWEDKLKKAEVSLHVIATGAGAGLQQALWAVPGSSAYLSGASFPYYPEETEELLGFHPSHFCDESTAVDLASAAYMKAFRAGQKTVGVGLTASVASEKVHRGDHRAFICVMTDDKVWTKHLIFTKGVGARQRANDGATCDDAALMMLLDATETAVWPAEPGAYKDASELARKRFFAHPFFTMDGYRHLNIANCNEWAMMPGAYNPPHEGHFGVAHAYQELKGQRVLFEVSATPPHKPALSVQDLLKRARMLRGHDRIFTENIPMYLDKARAYPGMPLIMGADTMLRILDPKWGLDVASMLKEMTDLGTVIYVNGREIDGRFTTVYEIVGHLPDELFKFGCLFKGLEGRWDVSSTALRNQTK